MNEVTSTEAEFLKSWDETEDFFKDLTSNQGWEYVRPILTVISHLRANGYDKVFRAGKSVYVLSLSRSQNYGLRDDQDHLGIMVTDHNTFNIHYVKGEDIAREFETHDVVNNGEFYRLLDLLLLQPIN